MEDTSALHVVVFPWLAMGHLIPYLELSKCLSKRGHRVSFISTPKNILRLPKIPPDLSNLISFVTLPLPRVQGLPEKAEASVDLPIQKSQLLKIAFDGLQAPVTTFLENSAPDLILYDYASHWLPQVAAHLGLPCAYFCLFNAATMSFFGPASALINNERLSIEDFTVAPKWVPFSSEIAYRFHEVIQFFEGAGESASGASDFYRFGVAIRDSNFVALRSCVEFEPEWIALLAQLYQKPIIPVGSLYPFDQQNHDEGTHQYDEWVTIREWLDKQRRDSVVYVALGSEASLSRDQVTQLALGLEQSKLPFFWALKKPAGGGSAEDELPKLLLPEGFEERTREQGVVYTRWTPQVKILAHGSVGGSLTHCGWNSVVEALGLGRPLVLLPVLNDQGLNARLLEGKSVGVEIARNHRDGSFTSESVAESLRAVMAPENAHLFRARAKEMKRVFADRNRMDRYVDDFIGYLKRFRRSDRADSDSLL